MCGPSSSLFQACRSAPKKFKSWGAYIVIADKRVSVATDFDVEHTDCEVFVQAGKPFIEQSGRHQFPDWRKVLPDFTKLKVGMASAIRAEYVARFAKINIKNAKSYGELRFWHERQQAVTIVQHMGVPEAISLIMPVVSGDDYKDFNSKPFAKFPQKPVPAPEPAAQPQDSAPA